MCHFWRVLTVYFVILLARTAATEKFISQKKESFLNEPNLNGKQSEIWVQ